MMNPMTAGPAPSRPTSAEIQDQKRRMNVQPAITDAQETADMALAQPPVGSVMFYAGAAEPTDEKWVICDNRLLKKDLYPECFAVLGTSWNYGGDPDDSFRIPSGLGRAAVGAGTAYLQDPMTFATYPGTDKVTLAATQVPNHNHGASSGADSHTHTKTVGSNAHDHGAHAHGGDTSVSWTKVINAAIAGGGTDTYISTMSSNETNSVESTTPTSNSHAHTVAIDAASHSHTINIDPTTGGGAAHTNVQPSIVMNMIIRVAL